jgi:hypothetical protein
MNLEHDQMQTPMATRTTSLIGLSAVGVVLAMAATAVVAAPVDEAKQIAALTGFHGGLAVHVGCGDGQLTAALHLLVARDAYDECSRTGAVGEERGETPALPNVYYIHQGHPNCSDANAGTSPDLPWKTIAHANGTLKAGDTVVIAAGTYEEEISPQNSGAAEAPITYVGRAGDRPVLRHVMLLRREYIRIIGIEITQNTQAYRHGIEMYASHHCQILNNYIHHTAGQAIRNNAYYGTSNYNTIRGNTITYTGYPQDMPGEARGHTAINLLCQHTLIEYNDISHATDFVNTNGGCNIIRNNYLHDFRNSDFPDGSGDAAHVDIWQPYGVPGDLSDHNVLEYNWASDNRELNSHFAQIRDETRPRSGEKEFIIRGNVAVRIGSYACQFGAIDNVHVYNNTFVDLCCTRPNDTKAWVTIGFNMEGDDPSIGSYAFNNIFYAVCRPNGGRIISVGEGCRAVMSNNACEESGGHASCSVTSGIAFADYAKDDLHLQSSSLAIDAGRPMTTVTSAAGRGTSFTVEEAGFFSDGFSIATGDRIRVGNNEPATILKIDHVADTVTVTAPISWVKGDPVVLAYQDTRPDIGAFEYRADHSYDVTLEHPEVVAPGRVRLVASVSHPENVRFVEFYVDNLPVGVDATEPFGIDWNVAGPGAAHHLAAVAYSRFASTQPTKRSSISQYSVGG